MTKAMRKLFLVELRRQWSTAAFFVPIALAALSFIMLLAMARMQRSYDVVRNAMNISMGFVVPTAVALFAVGTIATDVKEGWLRTLLIRPVTRQQYLLVKLATLYLSVIITFVVAAVLPNLITAFFLAKGEVRFDLVAVLSVHGLFLLQALLLLAMMVFFSCWLPGVFNLVTVAMWYIAASILDGYLQAAYWSNKWLMILREFFFPNGFTSATDAIAGNMGMPITEITWGLAALAAFLALAFWSIARIQVDKSSE